MYSGTVAVAVFSLAITLMNLYMSMSTSFNNVLLPRITVMATKESQDKEISDLFIKTGRLQFCILALILSGFIVFGRQFIHIWAGDGYAVSYIITSIFYVALICPLIQNVGITILLARGQQKFRSLTYLAIALVSLAGQVWVTPKYGAVGCACVIGLTLFAGQWVVMNIYYQTRQRLDIVSFWRHIIYMAIVPIIITAAGYYLTTRVELDSWLRLAVGILLFLAVYLPAFWLFSMNSYERTSLLSPVRSLINRLSYRLHT